MTNQEALAIINKHLSAYALFAATVSEGNALVRWSAAMRDESLSDLLAEWQSAWAALASENPSQVVVDVATISDIFSDQ